MEEWRVPCHTEPTQPNVCLAGATSQWAQPWSVWQGYQSKNTQSNTLYQPPFFLARIIQSCTCTRPVRLRSCVLLIRDFPTQENLFRASHYASSNSQIVMIDTTTQPFNGNLVTTNPSYKPPPLKIGQSPYYQSYTQDKEEEYTHIIKPQVLEPNFKLPAHVIHKLHSMAVNTYKPLSLFIFKYQ